MAKAVAVGFAVVVIGALVVFWLADVGVLVDFTVLVDLGVLVDFTELEDLDVLAKLVDFDEAEVDLIVLVDLTVLLNLTDVTVAVVLAPAAKHEQTLVAEFHHPPHGLDANDGSGNGVGECRLTQNCSVVCARKAL